MEELSRRIKKIRKTVNQRSGEARVIATTGKQHKQELELAQNDVDLYNKVAITLASIGEERQAQAQQQIEELVTRGLNAIFDDSLSFHVVQSHRGKTPEVKFVIKSFVKGKPIETSVMDARGGGLAAIVGFLLRLIILLLSKDVKEPILILDESFSHVSAEYERPLAEFIKELIDKTRVTIILVTHSDAFSEFADKRYRFNLHKGITKVEEF